jgi:hypothetical protein
MSKLFVAFVAKSKNDKAVHSNVEVMSGEITGIEDIRLLENCIKAELNIQRMDKEPMNRPFEAYEVSIINWRRFNT